MNNIVALANQVEYTPAMNIFDIRDYVNSEGQVGVYVIGGFVGELMLTFTTLYDYILANPSN